MTVVIGSLLLAVDDPRAEEAALLMQVSVDGPYHRILISSPGWWSPLPISLSDTQPIPHRPTWLGVHSTMSAECQQFLLISFPMQGRLALSEVQDQHSSTVNLLMVVPLMRSRNQSFVDFFRWQLNELITSARLASECSLEICICLSSEFSLFFLVHLCSVRVLYPVCSLRDVIFDSARVTSI